MKTSFFVQKIGFVSFLNLNFQPSEIYSQRSMIFVFNENFDLESIRSNFWWLPATFNEFVVLKSIFFCLDIRIFLFALLYRHSKGFMKALKAFKKPFEAPQGSVKTWCYGEDQIRKRMVRLRFLLRSFQLVEIQMRCHQFFKYQHL